MLQHSTIIEKEEGLALLTRRDLTDAHGPLGLNRLSS